MSVEQLDSVELYTQPPPSFGHGMHKYFGFDPTYINLNHGSYGSTPLPVTAAINKMTLEIEANPDHFHRIAYLPLLIDIRRRISQLIGANVDECVLVPNASTGVNIVLRNFEWEAGDIIVPFNTTYLSVSKTVKYISDVAPHPAVAQFVTEFPTTHAEILTRFRDHLRSLPKTEGKKTVAVIDSIVSNPGVLLPWQELVKICKEEGVWSVIDAAHSIGQEETNLSDSQPDFWVSNCHKWLFAKRSCSVLYVPERNQHIVKTSIPTSHTYVSPADRTDPNFVIQYEWNGTIDWAPYLSVAPALEFRNWLGGEAKINAYCHDMAVKGGKRLAEIFGTRVLDPEGDLTMNMVNVELPFPSSVLPTVEIDLKFKQKMLEEQKAYSAHFYHNGTWWTRCSAQVWTELEDFEKIGKAWLIVCAEVLKELGIKQDL
ncbi:pyridoxal phosphate-dependent transferase [Collybia nuda]|uniref:Pyridoxal phosphate-dependent transferase n=1 Tax=Collybia nuda TaxID=64659 RepID=A0A9P6CGZ4_9AGAR|nr:pyridoxal phosphate-dependent transferase [Collybia nuda]